MQVTWKSGNKRATDAPYMVSHAGGETLVEVDQTQNLDWLSLGTFNLNDNSQIKLTNNADGVVIADAIQFIPQASNSSGRVYYTHTNHLDAPVALSDDSGTVVWQASYTPFGKMTVLVDTLGADITPRFPGQYADAQTGFYYNYFRDYDPEIGRYVQSDPLGMVDGPNTYQYALSNPANYTDPTGQYVPQLIGFFIGAGLEYLTNECADLADIAIAGGIGAIGGYAGGLLGKTKGLDYIKSFSNQTKGNLGELLSRIKRIGSKRISGKDRRIPGQRAFPDHVYRGQNGNPIYVESKFGTAGLTRAQRTAQRVLGRSYQVDKWTYPILQNIMEKIGAVVGGTSAGTANVLLSDKGCGCKQ